LPIDNSPVSRMSSTHSEKSVARSRRTTTSPSTSPTSASAWQDKQNGSAVTGRVAVLFIASGQSPRGIPSGVKPNPAAIERVFRLPPEGEYGHRVVIDLQATSRSAFLKAANRPVSAPAAGGAAPGPAESDTAQAAPAAPAGLALGHAAPSICQWIGKPGSNTVTGPAPVSIRAGWAMGASWRTRAMRSLAGAMP